MIKRLKSGKNVRFTLPPESVLKCTIHALESKKPKKTVKSLEKKKKIRKK